MTQSPNPGKSTASPSPQDTWVQSNDERDRSRDLSSRREQPPARVPGYEITRCLGEGAYGSVWLATEIVTGKAVAIKFYTQRRGLDWSLLNREVEKLAVLYTSRNIVGLINVGWNADPPYYVMEYLENGSLARLLAKGPLPTQEAVRIGRDILNGLVHAHGSGILHCDLKPANVLLDKNHEARLADFGQSRMSHEQHHALGTMFFMAPEQADIKAVPDARWDVYAWGAVLYQALVGHAPHRKPEADQELAGIASAEDRLERYRQLLITDSKPLEHRQVRGVDRQLAEIIDRCLQIDPAQRFANAQAVLDAMDARSRFQARRPLLTLGIIVPIMLLVLVWTFASTGIQAAVRNAQENLLDRALESDVVTVRILARSIERELEDRMSELQMVAEDNRLPDALLAESDKPWENRTELRQVVGQWKTLVDEARRNQGLPLDTSWFVNNAAGVQVFRDPYDAATVDGNYSFRDYFHGRHENYTKDNVPADITPISKPHISKPYRSEATDAYRVAITVPIYSAKRDAVIGVLGRSIALHELLAAYKAVIQVSNTKDQVSRTIALLDAREMRQDGSQPQFELLDHPWMNAAQFRSLTDDMRQKLRLDQLHAKQLAALGSLMKTSEQIGTKPDVIKLIRSRSYTDPVSQYDPQHYGGVWLAAFWPVGNTDWIAVVQERLEIARQPVAEMERRLQRYTYLALVGCGALVALLWYFIFRAISEQQSGPADRRSPPLSL